MKTKAIVAFMIMSICAADDHKDGKKKKGDHDHDHDLDDHTCAKPTCTQYSDAECTTAVETTDEGVQAVLDSFSKVYGDAAAKVGKCEVHPDDETKYVMYSCKETTISKAQFTDNECTTADPDFTATDADKETLSTECPKEEPYYICGGVNLMTSVMVAALSISATAFN